MKITGIWLPIVTPFFGFDVDFSSYTALIDHYIEKGVTGLVPLATTGEVPTISDDEYFAILEKTLAHVAGRVPVIAAVSGNDTRRVIARLKLVERYNVKGVLIPGPYYNRPDQRGLYEHFKALSEATTLNILIYNIPYRTGRNIENKTIYRLAELENIVGIKDSCGDIRQTMELLLSPPPDFSILTGEDILFFDTLCLGGDGAILASAHVAPERFLSIYSLIKNNDLAGARNVWRTLAPVVAALFEEPSPAPIKYALKTMKLIKSDEVRLPLVGITDTLKMKLEGLIRGLTAGEN
jgi:4-hydroxy-tetrahydrodipicolinate synthase